MPPITVVVVVESQKRRQAVAKSSGICMLGARTCKQVLTMIILIYMALQIELTTGPVGLRVVGVGGLMHLRALVCTGKPRWF